MNHVAAQILDLVARLFPEEFADLDGYCSRPAAFLDDDILRAYQELQFYLAYLEYLRPLRTAGLSFCYPEVSAVTAFVRGAEGVPGGGSRRPRTIDRSPPGTLADEPATRETSS